MDKEWHKLNNRLFNLVYGHYKDSAEKDGYGGDVRLVKIEREEKTKKGDYPNTLTYVYLKS